MTGNESLIHKADCSAFYESQRRIRIFFSEEQKHLILGFIIFVTADFQRQWWV